MKVIYWTTTIIISAFLLLSSYTYLFSKVTIEGIKELGFPDFFRIQLAVLKLIAVFLLLIPIVPIQIKEWTYAGVGLFSHLKHRDSIGILIILIILFAILCVSNIYLNKRL